MTFLSCTFSRKQEENRWGEKSNVAKCTPIIQVCPHVFSPPSGLSFYLLLASDPYRHGRGIQRRSFVVGKSLATCGESFKMLSHFKLLIICSKKRPHTPVSKLLYASKERRKRNWKVNTRFWLDRGLEDPLSLVLNSQIAVFFFLSEISLSSEVS